MASIPSLRTRFVTYGPRATSSSAANDEKSPNAGSGNRILDALGALQVPHSFFKHFYLISVLSSLFWISHILTQSAFLQRICAGVTPDAGARSMSVDQVLVTWALMSVQGLRRLVESIMLEKPSASKMWFVHWLLGMAFYLAMGIAVWIEGASQLLEAPSVTSHLSFSAPSLRTLFGVPVFLLASGIQHDCHRYLASLPKYTLPQHPIFNSFVCPHYAAECMIYLSMAIVSTPRGAWVNRTVFSAFIFVYVNLSVTASSTKDWYKKKFGKDRVAHRWKMIPGVW